MPPSREEKTPEQREGPLRVTVAPEVVAELQDWSAPVRMKVEGGELICRRAYAPLPPDTPEISDDERWPKHLPELQKWQAERLADDKHESEDR